jgi:hypothetical protein
MENCLSRVWAHVVDRAKSVFQLALAGDLCRYQLAVANQFRVSFGGLVNADNMFLGDNQHVCRRLRLDVFKRKCLFVFINLFRRNFSGDDLAEEAVSHIKNVNKVMEHEYQTIRSFVSRQKRARYLEFVANSRTRTKFTHVLAHFRDIDTRYKRPIPPSRQNPREIERILKLKGAFGFCHAITENPDLDGKDISLEEALEAIVGRGMGAILSCIPGRLAFMETEDERFILERERVIAGPQRCVRFITPLIDADSRVKEGIFVAAYKLRDEGDIPPYQREELRSDLQWFNEHLPLPPPLSDRGNERAISWFKAQSKECISRVWSVVHILEESGVAITKITTKDPGYVIYEDEFQIVAWPSGATFK